MRIATAADFRKDVIVDVPGTELQIRCRRPNLLTQIANGVLSQELVQAALKTIQDGKFDMATAEPETVQTYAEFVDRWVCLAARAPRVVLTEAEVVGDDVIWIEDLEIDVKMAVLMKTIGPSVPEAVARFRDRGPGSAAPGPDSTEVRDAAVESVAGDGPDASTRH